jgi:hypothetical protein
MKAPFFATLRVSCRASGRFFCRPQGPPGRWVREKGDLLTDDFAPVSVYDSDGRRFRRK